MRDVVQNLYEQRRVEEDERRAAPTQARMVRLNFWNLVFVIVGVALAALMAWKQFHPVNCRAAQMDKNGGGVGRELLALRRGRAGRARLTPKGSERSSLS